MAIKTIEEARIAAAKMFARADQTVYIIRVKGLFYCALVPRVDVEIVEKVEA
jgi:hypothetical protein